MRPRDKARSKEYAQRIQNKVDAYHVSKYSPETFGLPESCTRGMKWNTKELRTKTNSTDSRLKAIVHK
jgi:hypothetical protein